MSLSVFKEVKSATNSPGRKKKPPKTIEQQVAKKLLNYRIKKADEILNGDMPSRCKRVRDQMNVCIKVAEPFKLPMILPSRDWRRINGRPDPNFKLDENGNVQENDFTPAGKFVRIVRSPEPQIREVSKIAVYSPKRRKQHSSQVRPRPNNNKYVSPNKKYENDSFQEDSSFDEEANYQQEAENAYNESGYLKLPKILNSAKFISEQNAHEMTQADTQPRHHEAEMHYNTLSGLELRLYKQQRSYEMQMQRFIQRNNPDPEIIQQLPMLSNMSQSNYFEPIMNVCPVCTDNIPLGTKAIFMPCGHNFHPYCLKTWLQHNDACPTCRAIIPKGFYPDMEQQ